MSAEREGRQNVDGGLDERDGLGHCTLRKSATIKLMKGASARVHSVEGNMSYLARLEGDDEGPNRNRREEYKGLLPECPEGLSLT